MSTYKKLLYRVEHNIAHITLNRPEKRNALDGEMIGEIKDALGQSAQSDDVRVVLLTGAGKDFCSGADIGALRRSIEAAEKDNLAEARKLADLFLQMRRHPQPIVAAVRGRALAGGCGLATACDIVLAAESAEFGYTEVNIGFVPAMVMTILRRSVSEKNAFELIASGERIPAQTALGLGMINHVFADDRFESEMDRYAAKLAAKSASAVSMAKKLLYQMDGMTFDAALEAGVETNALARKTEDFKRGVEAFLKKSEK